MTVLYKCDRFGIETASPCGDCDCEIAVYAGRKTLDIPQCPACKGGDLTITPDPVFTMVECNTCSMSGMIGDWLKMRGSHANDG